MNNAPFNVGQRVICIDDRSGFCIPGTGLVMGHEYIVRWLYDYHDGDWGVNVGTKANGVTDDVWISTRFVPTEDSTQVETIKIEIQCTI